MAVTEPLEKERDYVGESEMPLPVLVLSGKPEKKNGHMEEREEILRTSSGDSGE